MTTPSSSSRVRFGMFELDADRGELRKGGVAVRIAPQPFAVLQLLLARAGEMVLIVTREHQRAIAGERGFDRCDITGDHGGAGIKHLMPRVRTPRPRAKRARYRPSQPPSTAST